MTDTSSSKLCMSDSDSDDLIEGSWSLTKRKKISLNSDSSNYKATSNGDFQDRLALQSEKFEKLKTKSSEIMLGSSMKRKKTEIRRSHKLIKKALKDPWIKALVEKKTPDSEEETCVKAPKWDDVKPFLTVNDHLKGPVSHGDCGPKTELEHLIEDCIKEGDFEKAELLSDTLANREFGVKIANAFAAKRWQKQLDQQKAEEKKKQMKKIQWTFGAKERWQMKGNM